MLSEVHPVMHRTKRRTLIAICIRLHTAQCLQGVVARHSIREEKTRKV